MATDEETKAGKAERLPALLFQGGVMTVVFAIAYGTVVGFAEERHPLWMAAFYVMLIGGGLAAILGALMAIERWRAR
jgi:hypothetical protein